MRNYIKQYHKRFVEEEEGMELLQFAMVVVVVVAVFVVAVKLVGSMAVGWAAVQR